MKYEEIMEMQCPICGKVIQYDESLSGVLYLKDHSVAVRTEDCHGIPFRFVCMDCYDEVVCPKGYDGEYYTELDECIYEY